MAIQKQPKIYQMVTQRSASISEGYIDYYRGMIMYYIILYSLCLLLSSYV
jgi:hypothetical protein